MLFSKNVIVIDSAVDKDGLLPTGKRIQGLLVHLRNSKWMQNTKSWIVGSHECAPLKWPVTGKIFLAFCWLNSTGKSYIFGRSLSAIRKENIESPWLIKLWFAFNSFHYNPRSSARVNEFETTGHGI